MNHPVRNSDPETSYESAQQIDALAAKLRGLIKNLAREAGYNGLSINEAAASIPEHKPWSISPRFAEMISSGDLVRVKLGTSKKGRVIYLKRIDTATGRPVIVNFHPAFVPGPDVSTAQLQLWPIKAIKAIRAMKKTPQPVTATRRAL